MPLLPPPSPTWPYRADAAGQIACDSLLHTVTVTVTHPTSGAVIPLPATDVTVTFDEDWAPYAQATIKIAPVEPATLALLDPTRAPVISITAGYRYIDGVTEVKHLAALYLRSVDISHPGPEITLTAASREALLQDLLWSGPGPAPIPQASTSAALTWLISQADPTPTIIHDLPAEPVVLPDMGIPPGANLWKTALDLITDKSAWLYHDGAGAWHLTSRGTVAATAAANLMTGAAGTIISARTLTATERWADGVIVINTWRPDGAQADTTITGLAMASPTPGRWKSYYRDTPTTQAAANQAAQEYLERNQIKADQIEITAKAMYWIRPAATITADLPGSPQFRGRVTKVSYSYPAGRMTLTAAIPRST